MPGPTALRVDTAEQTPTRLALALPGTDRACLARVRLLLQHHVHPILLCLVGEQVPHGAKGPLVDLLIVLGADIILLSDIAYVAYRECLDAISVQRRD